VLVELAFIIGVILATVALLPPITLTVDCELFGDVFKLTALGITLSIAFFTFIASNVGSVLPIMFVLLPRLLTAKDEFEFAAEVTECELAVVLSAVLLAVVELGVVVAVAVVVVDEPDERTISLNEILNGVAWLDAFDASFD
jgi:hypothetical protein